jgi:hypothetical protein
MEKIKSALAWVGGVLGAILALFLIFRNTEDKAKTDLQIKDAKLEGKQEEVQKGIDKDKADLEKLKKDGVEEKKPDEVVDYWAKQLKKDK